MALGEWLRQVMVETSALTHRAGSVARLMASRQLVALRIESASHSMLFVERDTLRGDFMFLAGKQPKITELFRGNAASLVLERARLQREATKADVVVAPWNFFDEQPDTVRWYPFLDASLPLCSTVDEQLGLIPDVPLRKQLWAATVNPRLTLRSSHARKDLARFYEELYLPGAPTPPDALHQGPDAAQMFVALLLAAAGFGRRRKNLSNRRWCLRSRWHPRAGPSKPRWPAS